MMRQIMKLNDNYSQHCKRVLLTVANTYRPLRLSELITLAALLRLALHRDIVGLCGLISIRAHDKVVFFVHQPAKDDLIQHKKSDVVSRSINAMKETLQRNVTICIIPGFLLRTLQLPIQIHSLPFDTPMSPGCIIFARS
jgi:hypothetical protein